MESDKKENKEPLVNIDILGSSEPPDRQQEVNPDDVGGQ